MYLSAFSALPGQVSLFHRQTEGCPSNVHLCIQNFGSALRQRRRFCFESFFFFELLLLGFGSSLVGYLDFVWLWNCTGPDSPVFWGLTALSHDVTLQCMIVLQDDRDWKVMPRWSLVPRHGALKEALDDGPVEFLGLFYEGVHFVLHVCHGYLHCH